MLRRRVQIAAWAGFIGLIVCFLVLVVFEQRIEERATLVRGALVACLLAHLACVAYLRLKKCPACGERFMGAQARAVGSFTAMSQRACQNCGATVK